MKKQKHMEGKTPKKKKITTKKQIKTKIDDDETR